MELSFDYVFSLLGSCAHALRVELTFMTVLASMYAMGRFAGLTGTKDPLVMAKRKLKGSAPPSLGRGGKGAPARGASRGGGKAAEEGSWAALASGVGDLEEKLRDAGWVVPQVTSLCRTEARKALELYRAAVRAGADFAAADADECENMYLTMVTVAIRIGQADEALSLFKEARRRGPGVTPSLFGSATKLSTSKQLYSECLALYDFAAEDKELVVEDRSVWSCLLFCAVETKSLGRCKFFWSKLEGCGQPSCKDFGNMTRFASATGDWRLSLDLVQQMRQSGSEVDSVTYNTCLATCVACDRVDEARRLLEDMAEAGGVSDAITYNTLSKGYAKAGRIDQCFELFELMKARGVEPSQVTYGILLDSCINENQVAKAAEVFELMKVNGCTMNTVLYTTLIKGFARDGQVDKAMEVYEHMRSQRNVPPDLITFSILIKANCDGGRLGEALRLKEAMSDLGLRADEVIFNNLLGGCCAAQVPGASTPELAKRMYQEMVSSGIRPSNATFSILIRVYAQCRMLDEAVEMLRKEPAAQGVTAEMRLFCQLTHCCLRERHGRRAVEVYKMMLESSPPGAQAHSGMLGMCVKLNMLETAAEIMQLAAEGGGRVDQADADQVLKAAAKKRKTSTVEAVQTSMAKLGLRPGSV